MKKLIRKLIVFLIIICLCVVGYFSTLGYMVYQDAVKDKSIAERIAEIKENPSYTPLSEISETFTDAIVAVEDSRFYKHGGIDLISFVRAMVTNVKEKELAQGGSTISQQFAKNLLFSNRQSLARKAGEFFATYHIEKEYSKDEILELYLNIIYYGDGYYNIYDASMGYFGVEPSAMTPYQATLLAGIPNAPSVYAPTKNPELAQKRQDKVLERMVETKVLTKEEKEKILEER